MSEDKRREEVLRELELLPVWRLRSANAQPAAGVRQEKPAAAAVESSTGDNSKPVADGGMQPLAAARNTAVADAMAAREKQAEPLPLQPEPSLGSEPQQPVDEIPPPEPALLRTPVAAEEVDVPSTVISPVGDDRRERIMRMDWAELQQSVEHCPACNLCQTRTRTVFGIGDLNAEWLFVGEAPGAEEDRKGEPFVGQAGRLLDNMLAAIRLKRASDLRNVLVGVLAANRVDIEREAVGEV